MGPMDAETLHGLFHGGTIKEDTLIAQEGDEQWTPYRIKYPKREVLKKDFFNPPKGIRDEMVGVKKFNERSYSTNLSISIVADETEKYFKKSFLGSVIRLENERLVEIYTEEALVNEYGTKEPCIVSISPLSDGIRVSFLRVSGLEKILKRGTSTLALSVFFPPLALAGVAVAAATAGLERRAETLFWTFLEARIEELTITASERRELPPEDRTAKLATLWQLKVDGALTLEEFEAEKQALFKKSI